MSKIFNLVAQNPQKRLSSLVCSRLRRPLV